MRPAAEVLARIAVDERHRLDPQHHPSWKGLTEEQRSLELHAAHRQAEAFGLFDLEAEVVGGSVLTRRAISSTPALQVIPAHEPHPVMANMWQAEEEAAEFLT